MPAGAPYNNKNAEKWTLEEAQKLFENAISLTSKKDKNGYEYDFIGDVARELNTYHHIFKYLADKYGKELDDLYKGLLGLLETNCFYNGKKGHIKEASSIMNLKSNHKWTDRQDWTSQGDKIDGINYLNPSNKDE